MISAAEFLASEQAKKLPDWIKTNPTWSLPIVKKAFPDLGLENCRQQCEEMITPLVPYYNNVPAPLSAPAPVKMDIVFSSDGVDGLWDLLTKSMRGVLSCKSWNNAQHSKYIVDEAVHPTVGIIYLTDCSMTEYGESINRRALVYYSGNNQWDGIIKSRLTIDRIYTKSTNVDPLVYQNVDPDAVKIRDIFKRFISSKLKDDLKAKVAVGW